MTSQPYTSAQASLSFAEFDERAQRGESLTVAFFGGSLTWGAQATDPLKTSYRAIVSQNLQARYPDAHFTFVDAAIGGTGSQLGAFRLQRDVLAHEPDLVFLDFTINDGASHRPVDDRLSSYESLIRRMVMAGIPVVQVILAVKADVAPKESARPLDFFHKEIAQAYGLPIADALAWMRSAVLVDERATADELWDLPYDSTHPGDAGYALYAEAVWDAYVRAVAGNVICRLPEETVHPNHYMQVDRFELTTLKPIPAGWAAGVPHRNAVAFDFVCSRWMDGLVIAKGSDAAPPDVLRLKFKGESVLLFGESTPESGRYSVSIDGAEPVEYEAHCSNGNMRLVRLAAYGLSPGVTHTLEIRPLLKAGEELRLNSICIAGGCVEG
ncbi:MAG: SGNH/GDSL hydrolase family protein [Puniceicoccales bacterium]